MDENRGSLGSADEPRVGPWALEAMLGETGFSVIAAGAPSAAQTPRSLGGMSSSLRELKVPGHWRTLDFISDVHLEAQSPRTHEVWASYLADTPADAVFILGDLFEVWVGDDLLHEPNAAFTAQCMQSLSAAGQRLKLFFMHGNRDFLIGADFLAQCQATLLDDPCVLSTAEQRWLLSHGDAWCLDDVPYLAFRAQVRTLAWQAQFLAQPLAQRQALARQMREHSQRQQAERWQQGAGYVDVDENAARQALQQASATTLIHGHTHRPARHDLGAGLAREVLSDWDAQATPPRAQVMRLSLPAKLASESVDGRTLRSEMHVNRGSLEAMPRQTSFSAHAADAHCADQAPRLERLSLL